MVLAAVNLSACHLTMKSGRAYAIGLNMPPETVYFNRMDVRMPCLVLEKLSRWYQARFTYAQGRRLHLERDITGVGDGQLVFTA